MRQGGRGGGTCSHWKELAQRCGSEKSQWQRQRQRQRERRRNNVRHRQWQMLPLEHSDLCSHLQRSIMLPSDWLMWLMDINCVHCFPLFMNRWLVNQCGWTNDRCTSHLTAASQLYWLNAFSCWQKQDEWWSDGFRPASWFVQVSSRNCLAETSNSPAHPWLTQSARCTRGVQ